MPVYEYQCESCEHVTETLRSMADADAPIVCEQCGGEKTHRMHSVFAAGKSSPGTPAMGDCGGGMCGPSGGCPFA